MSGFLSLSGSIKANESLATAVGFAIHVIGFPVRFFIGLIEDDIHDNYPDNSVHVCMYLEDTIQHLNISRFYSYEFQSGDRALSISRLPMD